MSKLESKFQKELVDEIKKQYPECMVLKNDSGYIQGIPDWTILYKDKWVVLECKKSPKENHQPNQDYYVSKLRNMSYSAFIYPENKNDVLVEVSKIFSKS